jgi:ferredoxin
VRGEHIAPATGRTGGSLAVGPAWYLARLGPDGSEGIMKVVVDFDLCESNAVCMDVCPEVFKVDEDDVLHILIENPPERLRKQVEEAVRLCPRQAISLVEG